MICHASIANKRKHDSEGYFRKRESMQTVHEIYTAVKGPSYQRKPNSQGRRDSFKEDKARKHRFWHDFMDVTLLGYWLFQFVHTDLVNSIGKMK